MDVHPLDLCEHAKDEVREQIEAGWQSIQAGRISDGEAFISVLLANLDYGAVQAALTVINEVKSDLPFRNDSDPF